MMIVMVMVCMGVRGVVAIDFGVAAHALECFSARKPGDERANEGKEDDGLIHGLRVSPS